MLAVGVVGLGPWGRLLAERWSGVAHLVGTAERRPERRVPIGGAPVVADLDELLRLGPDLVVIASAPHEHVVQAREALNAGCHVYVEKPIAEAGRQAEELGDIAAKRGKILLGSSLWLRVPAIWALKAEVSKLGPLKRVETARSSPGNSAEPAELLADLLPHDLLWLCSLGRMPSSDWQVRPEAGGQRVEVEAQGLQFSAWVGGVGPRRREVRIEGEHGWRAWNEREGGSGSESWAVPDGAEPLLAELGGVVRVLEGRERPLVSWAEHVRLTGWLEAVRERTGPPTLR